MTNICFELLENRKKLSDYTIRRMIDLIPLYSELFCIPADEIYATHDNISFFKSYTNKKLKFDMEQIKLDIINNVSLTKIALAYKEPLKVIQEIKDNISTENYLLVSSKIYCRDELKDIIGGITLRYTHTYPILDNISLNKRNRPSFWLGQDILDIKKSIPTTYSGEVSIINEKTTHISIKEAAEIIGMSKYSLNRYIQENIDLYGVFIKFKREKAYTRILVNKNDIMEAKNNIKFYISRDEVIKNVTKEHKKILIAPFFSSIYNIDVSIKKKFIKKDIAIKIKKLIKYLDSDMEIYRKFLLEELNKSKTKIFYVKNILPIIYRGHEPLTYPRWKNALKSTLTKKEVIDVINSIKTYTKKDKIIIE